MVTIKDVAKKAGVSLSTASYALNNDKRVSSKTRDRIIAIADELRYLPSGTARNLKMRKSKTIGACTTEFGGPVHTSLLEGIHKELLDQGYNLVVTSGKSAERMLLDRQTDAVIVNDSSLSNTLIERVANESFPVIVIGRHLEADNIYEMTIDNERPTYNMLQYMIDKGYKEIAYISGVEGAYDNLYRFKGFVRAMRDNKLKPDLYYKGDFTKQSGSDIIKTIIENKQTMPRAFYCANDEMAIGVIETLKANDFHVPNDVAVAGFDDIELASYVTPPLTTIRINRTEFGKQVAQNILELCINNKTLNESNKVEGELIIRQST